MPPNSDPVPRLKPDPSVGVRDLMKPVMGFLKEKSEKDLLTLLEPSSEVSWKTRPLPVWLCNVAPLLQNLLKVDAKCIFPAKKLAEALAKIQKDHYRINFTRMKDDQFIDKACLYIRVAAAQLRELATKPDQYQRTMRKASIVEKQVLDDLIEKISLGGDPGEGSLEQGEVLLPHPAEEPKEKAAKPKQKPELSIFTRILSKKPSTPEKMTQAAEASSSQAKSGKPSCVALVPWVAEASSKKPTQQSSERSRKAKLADLTSNEEDLLRMALLKDVATTKKKGLKRTGVCVICTFLQKHISKINLF